MDTPIIHPTKRCTKCGNEYPATSEYFYPKSRTKPFLHSLCIPCSKKEQAEYRAKFADRESRRKKEYNAKNAVANAAKQKEWRTLNRERDLARQAEYREVNRERERERGRIYRRENPDIVRRSVQRWREANIEKERERGRKWFTQNKAKHIVYERRRRARVKALPATLTPEEWQRAIDYFNGCCAVCGRPLNDLFGTHSVAADHWIPLASPDCPGTVATNIVCLCHGIGGCNNSKRANPPAQWLEKKFGKRKAKQVLNRIETYFDWVKSSEKDAS